MFDSPGVVDFVVLLMDSVHCLPDGQTIFQFFFFLFFLFFIEAIQITKVL